MRWRDILRSRWVFLAGTAFSAPSLLDDFEFWRKAVGDMSAGWQGALAGIGGILLLMWLITMIANYRRIIGEVLAEVPPPFWAFLAFGVGVCVFAILYEKPTIRWSHPALSAADQERAHAECRMRALEVVGASDRPNVSIARDNYESDCLIRKGFKREELDGD